MKMAMFCFFPAPLVNDLLDLYSASTVLFSAWIQLLNKGPKVEGFSPTLHKSCVFLCSNTDQQAMSKTAEPQTRSCE